MLGKIEDKNRKVQQRMRWLDSITDSVKMNLSKLQKPDSEAGVYSNSKNMTGKKKKKKAQKLNWISQCQVN